YLFEPPPSYLTYGSEALSNRVFGDLKDQPLGFIYDGWCFIFFLYASRNDLVGSGDQPSEHCLGFDQPGIVLDGVGSGDAVDQRGDISCTPNLLELTGSPQLFRKGHKVDRQRALAEHDHFVVNSAMGIQEELVAPKHFNGLVAYRVVQQDSTQDRFFGF